ncbi:MAG: hypothetical protein PUC59_03550 [Firmicutes bacterium]|nr:hypothetical protein [Bacillota bacterium]
MAQMILAAVFFFVGNSGLLHSALFHYAAASHIFSEEACGDLPESHFTKLANDRSHSFCCVPMSLIIRMNDISDFNFFVFRSAVVDKADDFSV